MSTYSTVRQYGYIRVSTAAQSRSRKANALIAKGVVQAHIYLDKISGINQIRPSLEELLRHVRAGDYVYVHFLDRLGHTALHVMQMIAELRERKIAVRSLKEREDLSGATGKLMVGFMILVAE